MPTFDDVSAYLKPLGLTAMEFSEPTPTAPTAAAVIGCSVGEIAKTILVLIGNEPVAIAASGDARLNNPLLKAATGLSGKVRMLQADHVFNLVGYLPGGVCPFLLPDNLPVLLDRSLLRFQQVYPAAGTPASGVAVPVSRLPELSGGLWAEVCKLQEGGV